MGDKIINNGQMANDPTLESEESNKEDNRSYLIPESEDEFYSVKKKWKWKPSRLIFLYVLLKLLSFVYVMFTIGIISYLFFNVDFTLYTNFPKLCGYSLSLIIFKKWWFSDNETK